MRLASYARSDKMAAQLQQEGVVTFEAIILEVKRYHLSVVVDVEHADALDDIGAGASRHSSVCLRPAWASCADKCGALPCVCACTATLRWRMDQTLSSTTTKRELSAVEALSDLQLDHAALRARLAIIGNMQLAAAPNTWAR